MNTSDLKSNMTPSYHQSIALLQERFSLLKLVAGGAELVASESAKDDGEHAEIELAKASPEIESKLTGVVFAGLEPLLSVFDEVYLENPTTSASIWCFLNSPVESWKVNKIVQLLNQTRDEILAISPIISGFVVPAQIKIFCLTDMPQNLIETIKPDLKKLKKNKIFTTWYNLSVEKASCVVVYKSALFDSLAKKISMLLVRGSESISEWKEHRFDYPVTTFTPITYVLITCLVLLYFVQVFYAKSMKPDISHIIDFGGYSNYLITAGDFYRVITNMFIHADPVHLLLNCAGLWYFGRIVETTLRYWSLLALFFIGGIFGSLFNMFWGENDIISLGASAGVAALIFCSIFILFRYRNKDAIAYDLALVTVSAIALFVSARNHENINYLAHLGGAGAGSAFGIFFAYPKMRLNINSFGNLLAKFTTIISMFFLLASFDSLYKDFSKTNSEADKTEYPWTPEPFLSIDQLTRKFKNLDDQQSLAKLGTLSQTYPDDPRILLMIADLYYAHKEWENADYYYRRVLNKISWALSDKNDLKKIIRAGFPIEATRLYVIYRIVLFEYMNGEKQALNDFLRKYCTMQPRLKILDVEEQKNLDKTCKSKDWR